MNALENLMTEIGELPHESVPEPMSDSSKDCPDRDHGSRESGFFISPLRQPRSRAELERVWKDTE